MMVLRDYLGRKAQCLLFQRDTSSDYLKIVLAGVIDYHPETSIEDLVWKRKSLDLMKYHLQGNKMYL